LFLSQGWQRYSRDREEHAFGRKFHHQILFQKRKEKGNGLGMKKQS
jgi:hypothetical protein